MYPLTRHTRHRAAWSIFCQGVGAGLLLLLAVALPIQAADNVTDRTIAIYQRVLQVRPHDAESYYKLGDAYIEKGRETGDIAYFELASQALRKALQIDPELGPAHRHLALVLYTLHDFGGAIDQSQAALKLDPRDAYAYGVIGDARLETGDYDARGARLRHDDRAARRPLFLRPPLGPGKRARPDRGLRGRPRVAQLRTGGAPATRLRVSRGYSGNWATNISRPEI